MDRLQFSESLGVNAETQIKEHFDEIMGMYNLFGEYEGISIKGSVSDSTISFDIIFKDHEEAKELGSGINGMCIKIYGISYTINSFYNSNIVTVILNKNIPV